MLLYLIRHGQTPSNVAQILDCSYPGAPLTDLGHAQAEQVAQRLADAGIQGIYTSDFPRAVQTATPLATRLGLPITQLPGLREIPAGVEEGKSDYTNYLAAIQRWRSDPASKLEGGESATEFLARFDGAIATIAAQHQVAAVFSHGAAMRVWTPLRAANLTTQGERRLNNTDVIVLRGSPNDWWALSWAEEILPTPD